jgi:hypothetical protein
VADQQRHRTLGDVLRAELNRLGLAYSVDEAAALTDKLGRLPQPAPAAFAAAVSERLLRREETQPVDNPRAVRWRQLLNAIWEVLGGDDRRLTLIRDEVEAMERWLDARGGDVPPDLVDADLDHVAATLYAAQALLRGSPSAAAAAGARGTDAADALAMEQLPQDLRIMTMAEQVWLASHPLVQAEISRQRADITLLADRGIDVDVLVALRAQ